MSPFTARILFAAIIGFAFLAGAPALVVSSALAQSSQDMSLLTEQERQDFSRRLQHTASSAERAKITAEMNRVVQERRLEQRHATPQSAPLNGK